MVIDEFMLLITFYNRSSHMHDMQWKPTLIEILLQWNLSPTTLLLPGKKVAGDKKSLTRGLTF